MTFKEKMQQWRWTDACIDQARRRGLLVGGTFEYIAVVLQREVKSNEELSGVDMLAIRQAIWKLTKEAGYE